MPSALHPTLPNFRVGIIGLGNGGKSFAAHLSARGHIPLVYCCPGHRGEFNVIKRRGGCLTATKSIQDNFEMQLVDDLGEFIRNTDYILIVTVSNAHRQVVDQLLGYDLSNHILVVVPGNGFVAKARHQGLVARNMLETCTLPYASRTQKQGEVVIKFIKQSVPIASLHPLDQQDRLDLDTIFAGRLEWRTSILNIWLNFTNPVVHVPPTILNTGWIESGHRFKLYGDGITPAVANMAMALDVERIAIATANGEDARSVLEWTNIWYDARYQDWLTFARTSEPHNLHGLAPTGLRGHRYTDEDIKEILVFWYELGRLRGLELPLMRSVITLGSSLVGEDYFNTGNTLQSLGLGELSADEILDIFGKITS